MPDEPQILDEVIAPVLPINRPGSPHARGIGEGITIAVILMLIAGGMGLVAFGRPATSVDPSNTSRSAVATASSMPMEAPASPTAAATLAPIVTPATACAASAPPVPPIPKIHTPGFRWYGKLASATWLADPSMATPDPFDAADATTLLAEPLVVSLDNRWCALAWRFLLDGVTIASQDNPAMDQSYAAQNSWSIRLPATTDPTPLLRAELGFPAGWAVVTWRVTFNPSPIPAVFLSNGADTIEAIAGCGFSLELRNGAASADTCASSLPAGEPDHLLVDPTAILAFRVPGVSFEPTEEPVQCGLVGGTPAEFAVALRCTFDVVVDPSNAVTFEAPAQRGEWWLKLRGCTSRDGDRACGWWYAIVDVSAPGSSPAP
jgi:hypothetical protein